MSKDADDDNDYPPSKSGKKKASKTATELVNLVGSKGKPDHGSHLEKIESDGAFRAPMSFSENAPQGRTFLKLDAEQTFFEGLETVDPSLLSRFKGRHGIFTRYTVLPGHIGLASKFGQTKFLKPGNYFWMGLGGEWNGAVELQKGGEDVRVVNGEVTLLSLSENQVVVVQIDKNQYVIGSGRYIIRQPARLEGDPIDVQKLKTEHKATLIMEGGEEITEKVSSANITRKGRKQFKDKQVQKEVTAGWTEQQGAICIIRPEPGFRYVIQNDSGFTIGDEFTIARGTSKFLMFLNFLQQSRTTRTFAFLSRDFQDVRVRIQLTWQLVDGVAWLRNGRAYEDPFDLLEEKAEAAFRDQIGGLGHLEALAQKSDGFADMESRVLPKLQAAASYVGARLGGMEVRELSFPLIETREQSLAEREVGAKEKIREREIDIQTKKLDDQKLANTEMAEQQRKLQAEKANAEALAINDQRKLAEVDAKNKQKQAEVDGAARRELAQLEAKKEQEKIVAETAILKADAEAQAKKLLAAAEASAFLEVARAKNTAVLEEAEAQAQAAKKMAEALKVNDKLIELELAKLQAQVEIERAKAMALFASNPQAILPAEMARDLGRMRAGHAPQEFMPAFFHPGAQK
jgi:hypothetical protein